MQVAKVQCLCSSIPAEPREGKLGGFDIKQPSDAALLHAILGCGRTFYIQYDLAPRCSPNRCGSWRAT